MTQTAILFADNDRDFIETWAEFLQNEGYRVIAAFSPAEARSKLGQEHVDAAVIDIRLVNDDDEKDNTGIELAKEICRSVPVLLLTGYPSVEYARQVLKPQLDGLPIAYDFIAKQEGPEAMLTTIKRTLDLAKHRDFSKRPAEKSIYRRKLRLFFSRALTAVFVTFPRTIGRFILEIGGRQPSDPTATLFGYVIVVFVILVLLGVRVNTVIGWFVNVWRFFFPQ